MSQILFIFGPSGVGKSTFAEWLVENYGFLHINFDRWDNKGVDGKVIKNEMDKFFSDHQPTELRSVIEKNLDMRKGAVVTFPSTVIPNISKIKMLKQSNIKTVILYGSEENCLNAFIKREKEIGRNLSKEHWHKYNDHLYNGRSIKHQHAPYLVPVFQKAERKSCEFLINNFDII